MGGRPPADYRVDRPEVEAPRGAREPTGTNGPTLTNTSTTPVDRHPRMLVATMRITTNTTPHTLGDNKVKYWLTNLVVVIAAGKRPVSIPNLEAKPASADGTAPGRVWESRTPPQHSIQRVGPGTRSFQAPPALLYPQEKQKKGHPPGPVLQPKGRPLFCVSTSCYNTARVNTRPVVSENHAYVRNAVAIESAHAWRVMAPPARNTANTHLCVRWCVLLHFRL